MSRRKIIKTVARAGGRGARWCFKWSLSLGASDMVGHVKTKATFQPFYSLDNVWEWAVRSWKSGIGDGIIQLRDEGPGQEVSGSPVLWLSPPNWNTPYWRGWRWGDPGSPETLETLEAEEEES